MESLVHTSPHSLSLIHMHSENSQRNLFFHFFCCSSYIIVLLTYSWSTVDFEWISISQIPIWKWNWQRGAKWFTWLQMSFRSRQVTLSLQPAYFLSVSLAHLDTLEHLYTVFGFCVSCLSLTPLVLDAFGTCLYHIHYSSFLETKKQTHLSQWDLDKLLSLLVPWLPYW